MARVAEAARGPFTQPLQRTRTCAQCAIDLPTGAQFWGWDNHIYCSPDCVKRAQDPEYGHN